MIQKAVIQRAEILKFDRRISWIPGSALNRLSTVGHRWRAEAELNPASSPSICLESGRANSERELVHSPMDTSDCTVLVAAATPSTTGMPMRPLMSAARSAMPAAWENDHIAVVLACPGTFRGDHRTRGGAGYLQIQHRDLAGAHIPAEILDAVLRREIPGPTGRAAECVTTEKPRPRKVAVRMAASAIATTGPTAPPWW